MNNIQSRVHRLKQLTKREQEVLLLRGQGLMAKEIAKNLEIKERTVKFHLTHIYGKLELQDLSTDYERLDEIKKYCQLLTDLSNTLDLPVETKYQVELEDSKSFRQNLLLVLEDEVLLAEQKAAIQRTVIPILPPVYDQSTDYLRRNKRLAFIFLLIALTIGLFIGVGITALFFRSQTYLRETPIQQLTTAPTIAASSTMTNRELSQRNTLCGETSIIQTPISGDFLHSQGVSAFTIENTTGIVINNFVRSLTIDQRGVWIGYFTTKENHASGVGLYTKQAWINCNAMAGITNQNINHIKIDKTNKIWVATDGAGVSVFDGTQWHTYTTQDGLPSDATFGLTIDDNNVVWVATLEGVASFDGKAWSVPYSASNNTLFHNKVHAIAFDHAGNIWIGHINDGVSQYDNVSGKWVYHTTKTSKLGGNQIRDIVVRKADSNNLESVWFATADSGVSKFERGTWTVYQVKDGLPNNEVHALAIDKYNRIWAATLGGVAYLEGSSWITYDTLNTLSIAFGPSCQSCPYDDEHVWTGTEKFGLTHSRLPYLNNQKAVQVQAVCFESEVTKKRVCPSLAEAEINHQYMITATYPISLVPGEKLRFEVVVIPRTPYQLRQDRGDFLSNTAETNMNRYGTYEHIMVKGTVASGQPFLFTDYDYLLVAPQLNNNEQKQTFTSAWRVWMHTRYVGPLIRIIFTVRKQ